MKFSVLLLTAVGALLTSNPQAALGQNPQPARYAVIDLGTLPGGSFSQATYISSSGVVTGISTAADGTQHAVVWIDGKILDMGRTGIGGPNSGALGVNARLQVAGWAESAISDPFQENFCDYFTGLSCLPVVVQNGVMSPLPLLGGNNGAAGPINVRGEIVGLAETATEDPQCPSTPRVNGTGPQVLDFEAVIWGPKPGQKRQLRPLPGDTVGEGIWVNDLGQAVGVSGSCANTAIPPFVAGPHAVLWDVNGTPHDLGNLGGTANPALLGIGNAALAMNNKTQVTGAAALPGSTNNHAFLWTKATGMRDIGTLEGDVNSAGLAINDWGEVVGDSVDGDLSTGNPRPFVWRNGAMSDLNTLVPSDATMYLLGANGINDQGQIVGFGLDLNTFEVHAFLATPRAVGANAPLAREFSARPFLPQNLREAIRSGIGRSMK